MVELDTQFDLPRDLAARFEDFLRYSESDGIFPYLLAIKALASESTGKKTLDVDFSHVITYHDEVDENYLGLRIPLAEVIWDNPDDTIKRCDQALVNLLQIDSSGVIKFTDTSFHVRFFNLPKVRLVKLSKLKNTHIEKLHSFEGTVNYIEPLQPTVSVATWECKVCGASHDVVQLDEERTTPGICNVGGCKNAKISGFRYISKSSINRNARLIRVQENAEEYDPRSEPSVKDVQLYDDLAEQDLHVGDRVVIAGIVKTRFLTKTGRDQQLYIEAQNVTQDTFKLDEIEVTDEDEKKIRALAARDDVMELQVKSYAPNLYGLEEEKAALVLQSFGGTRITCKETKSSYRGDIHLLYEGDPGTGKSQLAEATSRRVPISTYVAGKEFTPAAAWGCAEQTKAGTWILKAGLFMRACNGIGIIDECDKIAKETMSTFNSPMEKQELNLAKASIRVRMKAPISYLLFGNPKFKVWNDDLPFEENITFFPDLLTRMDLVYVMRFNPDDEKLKKGIAKTALSQIKTKGEEAQASKNLDGFPEEYIDDLTNKKWIKLAKEIKDIEMTHEAKDLIEATYVGSGKDCPLTLSARSVEGMIRLATARAKVALRSTVEKSDVEYIIERMKASEKSITNGKKTFDVDTIQWGTCISKDRELAKVVVAIENLIKEGHGQPIDRQDVVQRLRFEPYKYCDDKSENLIEQCLKLAYIVQKKNGTLIVVKQSK